MAWGSLWASVEASMEKMFTPAAACVRKDGIILRAATAFTVTALS